MSTKTRRHRHQGHASNGNLQEGLAEKLAPAGQEVSPEVRFRLIQIRAYGLWEQAGRPGGDAARERFWCDAESEILASQAKDE
jgi:Protein of unknown function (DUF2934)